jgi:hypothetical protein
LCPVLGCLFRYPYGYTVFAGVRHLLFRQPGVSTSEVPHAFKLRAAAAGRTALGLDGPEESSADVVASHTIRAKDQGLKGTVDLMAVATVESGMTFKAAAVAI